MTCLSLKPASGPAESVSASPDAPDGGAFDESHEARLRRRYARVPGVVSLGAGRDARPDGALADQRQPASSFENRLGRTRGRGPGIGPPLAVCSRSRVAVAGRAAMPIETERRGVVP